MHDMIIEEPCTTRQCSNYLDGNIPVLEARTDALFLGADEKRHEADAGKTRAVNAATARATVAIDPEVLVVRCVLDVVVAVATAALVTTAHRTATPTHQLVTTAHRTATPKHQLVTTAHEFVTAASSM